MDEILRKKEEELKTELKKLQKIKEFNPNMSFLRRHARVRGHVLKWGINNVLRKVVPMAAKMTREEWKKFSDKQKAPYEKVWY
ncbi:high mobility group B protein 13-like isoform X2 [Raphanus sativus]|uniref:High mobility group B protein 13-like isoform X2 n=1 Tax=Raphanus sativus TaxID=3726 RepID=A0A9W3DH55_RAPSA|nr:high mobility group B protein 13-like isoform X2 [Raphanus sativus]